MRKTLAAAGCLLWLSYGSLAPLGHLHAGPQEGHDHGLGLDHLHDHVHDAPAREPIEHDHDEGPSDADDEAPIQMTAAAVKSQAKAVLTSGDASDEIEAVPPVSTRIGLPDFHQPSHDPPWKESPGPRGPPA